MNGKKIEKLTFYKDIPNSVLDVIYSSKQVAWDIETSGLNWKKDKIATCQLYVPSKVSLIVIINERKPKNLKHILENRQIQKVFHHAMFDLRFMTYKWELKPNNIACTKIASKILDPSNKYRHSLLSLLRMYLKVYISKRQRYSNWLSQNLNDKQINYAINDVKYLIPLLEKLEKQLRKTKLLELCKECFEHIPTRVLLDINDYDDVFLY